MKRKKPTKEEVKAIEAEKARGAEILKQIREADAYIKKHKGSPPLDKSNLIQAELFTKQNELIFDAVYFHEGDKIAKRIRGKETQKKKGAENYKTAKEILEELEAKGEKLPIKGSALERMAELISLWKEKRGDKSKIPQGDAWKKYQARLLKERKKNKV